MSGTNADQVIAPTEGSVYSRSNVATAERVTVPDEWIGRYVTIEAFAQDVYILFGDGSVTATVDTRNAKTGEAMNKADGISWCVAAGTRLSVIVRPRYVDSAGISHAVTSMSFISAAATGFWQARADSQ